MRLQDQHEPDSRLAGERLGPELTPEKIEQMVTQIAFTFAVDGIDVPRERATSVIQRALGEALPDL